MTWCALHLRGVPEEQASVFAGEFLASYFAEELRSGLARSNYRFPAGLRVEISTTSKLPEPNEDWLSVDTRLMEPPASQPAVAARQPASLLVTTGTANQTELKLEKNRINIAARRTCITRRRGHREETIWPSLKTARSTAA